MTIFRDSSLQSLIEAMAVPGVLVDHRVIVSGDENALLPEEAGAFAGSVVKVRRASGAARIVARGLLFGLGQPVGPVVKSASGAPRWPDRWVGSLAHDASIAVAAIARRRDYASIGVDIEPAEALGADLVSIVATPRERREIADDAVQARLLFAVKEAVYKAVHPLEGRFLDHHDVEIRLSDRIATVRGGRVVPFQYCIGTHFVALAYIAG